MISNSGCNLRDASANLVDSSMDGDGYIDMYNQPLSF